MIPRVLELRPDAQVLLVGVTAGRRRQLRRRNVLDRVCIREPAADPRLLATYYAACDVFVSAAEIGESWSVAIGEAMALGIPVVTCSTPWTDNGQIEQVEEGVTGHVAGHPRMFAEACAALLDDPKRARAMGQIGAARIEEDADARLVTRQLERLYRGLVSEGVAPDDWRPSAANLDAFPARYRWATRRSFRPMTRRERAETVITTRTERLRWAMRAVTHTDVLTIEAWLRGGRWSILPGLARVGGLLRKRES